MTLPPLDGADGRHVLVLPPEITPDEVEILARSRFPRARWETVPTAPAGGRGATATPGVLRLSRLSTLVGPFGLDPDAAAALGVPTRATLAYWLDSPVERGDAPWPGGGDRDGLARVFAGGMPVRDEERTVTWLVAAAKRLGGAVRVAVGSGSPGGLLVPDPASAVDLAVWTDVWLEPQAALEVIGRVQPHARLNIPPVDWDGPPPGTGERPVRGAEGLSPELRATLHAQADERDLATLADPPPMEAYGCLVPLDVDGMLAVEISGETELPPVVAALPWAERGAVVYRVRWEPPDVEEMHAERPGPEHRVARGRATPAVVAVAKAIHDAVGGEITDEMDFAVDPTDL